MGSIQDAFTSTDPNMVELRSQLFCQASMVLPHVQVVIQGKMVSSAGGLLRYPVDDIMEPTTCTLQVPFSMA